MIVNILKSIIEHYDLKWINFQTRLSDIKHFESAGGKFPDQGDAKWIVIREQLWGHNVMPFGRPTPGPNLCEIAKIVSWFGSQKTYFKFSNNTSKKIDLMIPISRKISTRSIN